MGQLINKVIVVTGAASGIGAALARVLDSHEAKLVLIDIDESALERVSSELKQVPLCFSFDVSDRSQWITCREKISAHFQGIENAKDICPVDGVINNAGIAHESALVDEISEQDFKKVMDVNFYGVLHGTQTFLSDLKQKEKAWLVNISSIFGVTSIGQLSAYCTSKFAVKGFTEALRMEAALYFPNVQVTVVHPGGIDTPIAHNAVNMRERDAQERKDEANNFSRNLVTSPAKAAQSIVNSMLNNKSRVLIGADAKLMDYIARLFPVKYSKIILREILKRGVIKLKR